MPQSKQCFKCGEVKPVDSFYRHPAMADGLLGKCKECTKADTKANYLQRRDQRLAYEQSRNARPERKQQQRESMRRKRAREPQKYEARQAVHAAIRTGRLYKEPCEVCGDAAEAHHEDYSQPLVVRWLCHTHHRMAEGRSVFGEIAI